MNHEQDPDRNCANRGFAVSAISEDAAIRPRPGVIRKRPDFLAANAGRRMVTPAFILLVHRPNAGHAGDMEQPESSRSMRYGITVTKKIGNAVVRNRIKRRFRELLREVLPLHGLSGADHILIARHDALDREFSVMRSELASALEMLHKGGGQSRSGRSRRASGRGKRRNSTKKGSS